VSTRSENHPDDRQAPKNRQPTAGRGRGTTGRAGARELAAALLAAGSTIKDAAAKVGVGERTLRTWLDGDPKFQAMVQALRRRMVDAALGKLADGMAKAAEVLRELTENADPDVRHKAAVIRAMFTKSVQPLFPTGEAASTLATFGNSPGGDPNVPASVLDPGVQPLFGTVAACEGV
jgi:hypothetical protein